MCIRDSLKTMLCCFFFHLLWFHLRPNNYLHFYGVSNKTRSVTNTHTHSYLSIVIIIWYFCFVYGKKMFCFFSDMSIANANSSDRTKWWRRKSKAKPSNTKEFCKCRTNLWNVWNSVIYLCIQVAIIANPINRLMQRRAATAAAAAAVVCRWDFSRTLIE